MFSTCTLKFAIGENCFRVCVCAQNTFVQLHSRAEELVLSSIENFHWSLIGQANVRTWVKRHATGTLISQEATMKRAFRIIVWLTCCALDFTQFLIKMWSHTWLSDVFPTDIEKRKYLLWHAKSRSINVPNFDIVLILRFSTSTWWPWQSGSRGRISEIWRREGERGASCCEAWPVLVMQRFVVLRPCCPHWYYLA